MRHIELLRKKRGSMTVEAAILMPVVIFSIMAAMYMAMLLYHRACLQSLADGAARRAAVLWRYPGWEIDGGIPGLVDLYRQGLYWRITDTEKTDKITKLKEYAQKEASCYGILKGSGLCTEVLVENHIIYKKLVVIVEESFKIPVAGLFRTFGMGDFVLLRVRAEAILEEPVELIRNTDFVLDLGRELEGKYPGLKDLGDKTRELMGKIEEKLACVFN